MVGFYLCQADKDNLRKRYFARFGSIPLNDREQRFSQPKLELYGLFHALCAYKIFIIGVRNFIVEVDTRYIHSMLNNPDIAPSASINRWIVSILTFHFELQHIPGKQHGPNGLSRRPPQPGDLLEEEDNPKEFNDWVDNLYGFTHLINPSLLATQSASFLFTLASQLATPRPSALAGSDAPIEYYKVPCSEAVIQADK